MFYIKWFFTLLIWSVIAVFLWYTLPRHDVVQITGTDIKRVNFEGNSWFWSTVSTGGEVGQDNTADVYMINAIRPNGQPRVYRNQDTGWHWPPYFKFNSADLQAKAQSMVSTAEAPKWVLVRYYGWRFNLRSLYPNAVKVWAVDSPDHKVINWFNIIFIAGFVMIMVALWRRWRRFRERRIDPVLDRIDDWFIDLGLWFRDKRRDYRDWRDRRRT
ncbi:DUF1523 family protein [Chachezhania sediminis]|uniref:DUF1523 family protein n=1 Tax=Chachezhania sediminis TaxID=2599291 RepID=UPI00131CC529|nr:DUF1523 family protein [Chachezhania sediminis]